MLLQLVLRHAIVVRDVQRVNQSGLRAALDLTCGLDFFANFKQVVLHEGGEGVERLVFDGLNVFVHEQKCQILRQLRVKSVLHGCFRLSPGAQLVVLGTEPGLWEVALGGCAEGPSGSHPHRVALLLTMLA